MSELFYSAAELAAMQLPNFPTTRQAVDYRAKREGWHVTVKKGIGARGRLNVYALNDLPKDLRTAIQAKTASDLLEKAKESKPVVRRPSQAGLPLDTVIKGYNKKQVDCAHARMSLVAEVLHIHRTSSLPLNKAVALMVEQIELGALNEAMMKLVPIANNKSGGASKIGQRSLAGWVAAYKKAGSPNERLVALAPGKGKQELPIEAHIWLGDFLAIHCRPQNPPLAHSYQDFAEWYGNQPAPAYTLPSYDAVKRVWNKLPEIMRQRGRKTGPAYTKILPHEKRDWDVLEPNDVWIGDGHSFKAKVQHPVHGSPFKPEVTVVLDGCTRMVMGFSVSFAESCIAVCDALRIGMKHFGLPLIYYSDNGAGQTGKTIDHEITGIAARLAIHHVTGIPSHPQGRGIIERWWKDNLVRLARSYDTFVGTGMDETTKNTVYRKLESAIKAERKGKELTTEQRRYRQKLPTWNQFIADVAATIDKYNKRPHSELPKKADGQRYSPAEYRQHRIALMEKDGLHIEMLSHMELDTLFRPEVERTVRNGWLDMLNFQYFGIDLAAYHGKKVRVSYDLDDASSVKVYDVDGHYICRAELNGNKHPAFDVDSVRSLHAKKRADNRAKRLKNQLAEVEAERRGVLDARASIKALASTPAEELPAETPEVLEVEYEEIPATGTDGTSRRKKDGFRYF